MLHVRVDERLKKQAAEKLDSMGLSVLDAVRVLLTRVAQEGIPSVDLAIDPHAEDAWFRSKVWEAPDHIRPAVPHAQTWMRRRP
jgi:DNA-damage-inducible protein J